MWLDRAEFVRDIAILSDFERRIGDLSASHQSQKLPDMYWSIQIQFGHATSAPSHFHTSVQLAVSPTLTSSHVDNIISSILRSVKLAYLPHVQLPGAQEHEEQEHEGFPQPPIVFGMG